MKIILKSWTFSGSRGLKKYQKGSRIDCNKDPPLKSNYIRPPGLEFMTHRTGLWPPTLSSTESTGVVSFLRD